MERDDELLNQPLKGAHLTRVLKRDCDWVFEFDTGCAVGIYSCWRLVSDQAIEVTSEDHGQRFGLPAAVDAGLIATEKIGRHRIVGVSVNAATSDLSLRFESGLILQFINISSEYESWGLTSGATQVIARNGEIVVFQK